MERNAEDIRTREISVSMYTGKTLTVDLKVTEEDLEYIRINKCLPDHLYLEMQRRTKEEGTTAEDYSVQDDEEKILVDWN